MIFIIITIIASCFIKYIWKVKYQIPYTFILLLFGSILGIISKYTNNEKFTRSINFWANINPHNILLIFIPPLIYNSSAHIDFHIFKNLWKSICLLIIPGVILSTALIAISIKFIDNSFNWSISFLLGSLLSATDPIAVVSILKNMGINEKLAILIDGESLLNDGTASVIFAIMIKIIDEDTILSVILNSLQLTFGTIIYALLFSLISFLILKRVYNDELIEISMTLIFPHLIFFLAENVIHVSGILSLSILGLFTSYSKYTAITPNIRKSIEHFWSVIDFIANNIIFVLTGLIIIQNILNNNISLYNWLNLFYIYLLTNFIRFIIIFAFYPLLKNKQYKFYTRELIIISLSGLRGEITLALALITRSITKIDKSISEKLLFYAGGIVFLSIFINSILIKLFIKNFMIVVDDDIIYENILHIKKHISDIGEKTKNLFIIENNFLKNINWTDVDKYILFEDKHIYHINQSNHHIDITMNRIINCKIIFLKCLKKSFWNLYHKHMIYRDAIIYLVNGIDNVLDTNDYDWTYIIEPYCNIYNGYNLNNRVFQYFQKKILFYHINHHYSIISGFILGQTDALLLLDHILDEKDNDLLDILKLECNKSIDKGLKYIHKIEELYPNIATHIETRQTIHFILKKQQEYIKNLAKNGEINQHLFYKLLNEINKKFYKSSWI